MTIEQLLEKLKNDRVLAERVRHDCCEKCCELRAEIKDIFDYAYNTDDLSQQLDELRIRLRAAEYDERMACYDLFLISITIDTIDKIKKRLGRV